MAYDIHVKSELSDAGAFGAILFVSGPIASAIGFGMAFSGLLRPGGNPGLFSLLLEAGGGIAFLVGCVMLFTGRRHIVTINKPGDNPKAWGPDDRGTIDTGLRSDPKPRQPMY